MINDYFNEFDTIVNNTERIVSSSVNKRKINDFLGIIEGQLVFDNGILDILEVVTVNHPKVEKSKYKYHFRDLENVMMFRYDNAPHHIHLASYPHHKHIGNTIDESMEPDIFQVINEVVNLK